MFYTGCNPPLMMAHRGPHRVRPESPVDIIGEYEELHARIPLDLARAHFDDARALEVISQEQQMAGIPQARVTAKCREPLVAIDDEIVRDGLGVQPLRF